MCTNKYCVENVHVTNSEVNISHETTTVVVWIYDGNNSKKITTCFGQKRPSSGYYNFAERVSYICLYCEVMLRSHHRYALPLNKLILTRNDDEISASPRIIGIYMILFEQNCNELKMAAIGRNM